MWQSNDGIIPQLDSLTVSILQSENFETTKTVRINCFSKLRGPPSPSLINNIKGFIHLILIQPNGKEATVNRTLDGSTYPC